MARVALVSHAVVVRIVRRRERVPLGALTALLLIMALAQLSFGAPHPSTVETTRGAAPRSVEIQPRGSSSLPPGVAGADRDAVRNEHASPAGRGGQSLGQNAAPDAPPRTSTIPTTPTLPPISLPPLPPPLDEVPVPILPGDPGECPVGAPSLVTERNALGPGLYVANSDGTLVRLLDDLVWAPAWTPDGLDLTFARHMPSGIESVLCVSTATGTPLRQLYKGLVWGVGPGGQAAEWSRNQRQVLFAVGEPVDDYHPKIMVGDNAGGPAKEVVDGDPMAFAWLRGGNRLAFATSTHVESIAADGTSRRPIDLLHGVNLATSGLMHLSPAGDRLAFVSREYDLSVVNLDGTGFRRLWSSPDGAIQWFAWSPRGDRLVVDGNDGHVGLYVVNADGSDFHRIANGYCFFITSSPIADWVAYVESFGSNAGDKLRLTHWDGTDNHVLVSAAPGNAIATGNGWSPDGTRLVFAVRPFNSP